ncbi:hypothetical protein O7047_06820 [Pseudenterobacter timonensis]|uniref:Lipoprotein n=1 Tax=Pseudenterobacter timonensis TaxID=1755099 RepID=A0AAE4IU83_9ENTR|nr:hypothetical protein [Pseudenterobacter timonensis]MDR9889945.1 hypothetical protein [Pseudenterobacter timonensis]
MIKSGLMGLGALMLTACYSPEPTVIHSVTEETIEDVYSPAPVYEEQCAYEDDGSSYCESRTY